jgi:hypothetical protein
MLCWRIACFNYCLSAFLQFVNVCADPLQDYDVTLKPKHWGLDHNSLRLLTKIDTGYVTFITFPKMIPFENKYFIKWAYIPWHNFKINIVMVQMLHRMKSKLTVILTYVMYVCIITNQM